MHRHPKGQYYFVAKNLAVCLKPIIRGIVTLNYKG